MFTCPNCQTVLIKTRNKFGIFWECPACHGRTLTIEAIRQTVPRPIVNELWQRARSGNYQQKRKCPSCERLMIEVPILDSDKTEYIDVCLTCHLVWFDTDEYQELPKNPVEEKEMLSPKARELLALSKLELYKQQLQSDSLGFSAPDSWWELLPAVLGFPVEYDEVGISHKPIVTWVLSILIAAVSIAAFFNLKEIVNNWGLVPADFTRHYGLTFISSFFLHGGVFHLVGNLYFLFVFGDNVEDFLGKSRYLLLIFLAAAVGAIAHIIGDPHSEIPCIGASGGIAGVITYYALRFPQNRVGLLYFFRMVRLPVMMMFLLWVIMQISGAFDQIKGFSNVSSLAHLGGMATGFVFWLVTRPRVGEN
jgi:membrane associated rhomboid family serine protease